MAESNNTKKYLNNMFGADLSKQVNAMDNRDAERLATVVANPRVKTRLNRNTEPMGLVLNTDYGSIELDGSLNSVQRLEVNGQEFTLKDNGMSAIEKLTGSEEDVLDVLGTASGRQFRGRKSRVQNQDGFQLTLEQAQEVAMIDFQKSGMNYQNYAQDLQPIMNGTDVTVGQVMDEVNQHGVSEEALPYFLTHDSEYREVILGKVLGYEFPERKIHYDFEDVNRNQDTFVGHLLDSLDADEGQYDRKKGVLQIGERKITNLPDVDEKGVFHNGDTSYLPFKSAYFASGGGSRVSRLRVVDNVQSALDATTLQYKVTRGDIKFKTILDVTRNLPDFDKHPYGDEILETLKNKIVLDKDYEKTNSLRDDFKGNADDLGAVATTMLDADAAGIIDPLGTSNGGNMGKIMYLTRDAKINKDGSLEPGVAQHSAVGEILDEYNIDRDNFNRNQMSFNAFLTSVDVQKVDVAYAEFALWNSEDAAVATKHGAETMFSMEKKAGDKIMDFHGNKSTLALIADPDMSDEEADKKQLTYAKKFAEANPDLDLIVSPVSINSRLNMGVPHEGLAGKKRDLHLPNGDVVKDGITTMMYMSLPQTAEHKSKDYEQEKGKGRKYSTLLRYGLSSKVGNDMYKEALIDPETRKHHMDEIVTSFERLGVSFEDPEKLTVQGNVKNTVDADAEISATDLKMMTPIAARMKIMNEMQDGKINIDLEDMAVMSPFTKEPIHDDFGSNVMPIRVEKDGSIPYRYMDVLHEISMHNQAGLQRAYERASAPDMQALVQKDNKLKNINTMNFTQDAHTDVLIPDPRLKLNEIRSSVKSDQVIIHRDPVIQSGNVMSVDNVREGEDNVVQVNPLIETMMDADNDGDTLGVVGYNNLHLDAEGKQKFYDASSVEEQVNQYGRVFLGTDSSHFKAAVLANGLDDSDINFDDGKSNKELIEKVEDLTTKILDSEKSYGAYALSFTDERTVIDSLTTMADDGIKGKSDRIKHVFDHGYSDQENGDVLKALIAKSEWTGMAGSTTNNLIGGLAGDNFNKDLVRTSMDVTHSMTQRVLQMKNNANDLGTIDANIKMMNKVMSGEFSEDDSRRILKDVTNKVLPEEAVDKFVDLVSEEQKKVGGPMFGNGVINQTKVTTDTLAFANQDDMVQSMRDLAELTERGKSGTTLRNL